MCSVTTCLILATLGTAPTPAQQSETHRLWPKRSTSHKPGGESATPIWSDKLPESSQAPPASKTPFQASTETDSRGFTTSFKDGDRTIIVSSINEDCASSRWRPTKAIACGASPKFRTASCAF